ncbi:hypothetical protein PoB_000385700 [Plakobranchus ocellatus]|uniref:Secreted protein n=1 Tax=Plakobranchus ocellatus TaxID=259542 RepID=A0AAV3Y4I4_9GAST|nr:hypothetical protein PoB_000385700 [Plakobranchus ocellatus]
MLWICLNLLEIIVVSETSVKLIVLKEVSNLTKTIVEYGLFKVSARVFHYHDDFLQILTSLKCHNAKQPRLTKALQNAELLLVLLLECLAIVYHKVTGPFWSIVISLKPYHNLHTTIPDLAHSLGQCCSDQTIFLKKVVLHDKNFCEFRRIQKKTHHKNEDRNERHPHQVCRCPFNHSKGHRCS